MYYLPHHAPWQLQHVDGLCIALRLKAMTSHPTLVWWEQEALCSLLLSHMKNIQGRRYLKGWGQTVCASMDSPRLRSHGWAMVEMAKRKRVTIGYFARPPPA